MVPRVVSGSYHRPADEPGGAHRYRPSVAQITPTSISVPFLDLGPSHAPLKAQLLAEIGELIDSGAFANGPAVAEFEHAFADYCGTTECVGVASGLDGLRLSLLAAGIGHGDEVIVPAMTFVATFEAVSQTGATPVPVDVAAMDYGLDIERTRAAVNERTRAIMPVHLYGQLSDMRSLAELAAQHQLLIVEDACQAHGADRDGIAPGQAARAAVFSFYPGKNLGAMGDAGAIVTDDVELSTRLRALREHGQVAKYRHEYDGYTSRLDTLQALVLLRKLPLLDTWNDERRGVASRYLAGLADVEGLTLPNVAQQSRPVWHLFVVRTADPDGLASFLRSRGIGSGRHYPEPPHLAAAWRRLGHEPGSFPEAEALARECLSLPLYPGMAAEQGDAVIGAVRDFFRVG
jgi:dTDP-3-amino-3,4,6-trideoxy-alpha-D-glucose transaminase